MCGIYLTNHPFSEKDIQKKLNRMHYRGPNYQGFADINTIRLGHNRLSIIDLDPRSHQPMQIRGYYIVFNGSRGKICVSECENIIDLKKYI